MQGFNHLLQNLGTCLVLNDLKLSTVWGPQRISAAQKCLDLTCNCPCPYLWKSNLQFHSHFQVPIPGKGQCYSQCTTVKRPLLWLVNVVFYFHFSRHTLVLIINPIPDLPPFNAFYKWAQNIENTFKLTSHRIHAGLIQLKNYFLLTDQNCLSCILPNWHIHWNQTMMFLLNKLVQLSKWAYHWTPQSNFPKILALSSGASVRSLSHAEAWFMFAYI